MMASIVTTRTAAANISTSFGMVQFSPMTGAVARVHPRASPAPSAVWLAA
jgi:hypothetical protein